MTKQKAPDWDRIRGHYRRHTLEIYRAGAADWGIDPYAWDFEAGIFMSPIEAFIWSDIRQVGAVMYPQYPVGRYFVDFGNPVARVAIECDGERWHVDQAKDAKRQAEIEEQGWTVYRISGSQCAINGGSVTDEHGRERYASSPGYLLVKEIAERHGIRFNPSRPSSASMVDDLTAQLNAWA